MLRTVPAGQRSFPIGDLISCSVSAAAISAGVAPSKFVPAFAAFEKNRLSLYREAAKEAEEIFDRWADEIDDLDEDFMEDEDYEPDEYYSD